MSILALAIVANIPLAQAAQNIGGAATVLQIQSVPPNLPADAKQYQSIVVSLADSKGNPSIALNPILVNLFSSQPNVAAVNASVTIQTGHDFALAILTTTSTPGLTAITATATGYQSSFVTIRTLTPSGLASTLKVWPAPATVVSAQGATAGSIYVELTDDTGLPAKAATDTGVSLSSSNPLVVQVSSSSLTIPAGEIFATVPYTLPSTSTGTATVSAISPGYTSGSGEINVVTPIPNVPCCKVAIRGILASLSSNSISLPADGRSYAALELLLEDSTGTPVRAPSNGITVQLTSTKDTVASVGSTAFIPSGSTYALVDAQASFLAGTANITAVAQGYSGSAFTVQTIIPAPSKLTVYVAPTPKILTSLNQPVVVVQLQDANGNPARAKADTTILITSSNATVLGLTSSLTISKGGDFVSTFVSASKVGATTLTASSSGLTSSQAVLQSTPLPLTAVLSSSSSSITTSDTPQLVLVVSLVGLPLDGASVTWKVNSGTLSGATSSTNTNGVATATFIPGATGLGNVTAIVTDAAIGQTTAHVYINVNPTVPPPPPSLAQQVLGYSYLFLIPIVLVVVYLYYRIRQRRGKRRAELEAAFQTVG